MYARLKFFLLFALTLYSLGLASCSGTSPAGPPAPPAQIPGLDQVPGYLVFPDTIEVPNDASASPSLSQKFLTTARGIAKLIDSDLLTAIIELGVSIKNSVFSFVAAIDTEDADSDGSTTDSIGVLAAYSNLKIPTSTDIKYCEFNSQGGKCFDGNGSELTNQAPLGTTNNTVYLSFLDFDLDQDGNKEGCTGNSCPANCTNYPDECANGCPTETSSYADVCVRIWSSDIDVGITDITPTLAMRLDKVPCNALLADPDTGRRSTDCLSVEADTDTTSDDYVADSDKYLNPGQGAYRSRVLTPDQTVDIADSGETWPVDVLGVSGVVFNHTASDDSKTTDVSLMQIRYDADTSVDDLSRILSLAFTRAMVYQDIVAASDAIRNRVSVHYVFGDYSADYYTIDGEAVDWFGGTTWLKYLERTLADRHYWSGYNSSYTDGVVVDNACAENTGFGTTAAEYWEELESTTICENLDIDVSGLDFADYALTEEDINGTLPNNIDFPRDTASEFPQDYCEVHTTFTGCP